jgi:hypothetical protein
MNRVFERSSLLLFGRGSAKLRFIELDWRLAVKEIIQRILQAAKAETKGRGGYKYVRTARILERALREASDLSAATRQALRSDEAPMTPAVERYHEVLVRLVYSGPAYAEPLLEGQGNFGSVCLGHPDYPPAHPLYTECRITQRGIQYLADSNAQ